MLEAAIVLPIFLVMMTTMMKIAVFCFHMLRFQYEVSEITRQAFTLDADTRAAVAGGSGPMSWENFIVSQINLQAQSIGLATQNPADKTATDPNAVSYAFVSPTVTYSDAWDHADIAEPGWVFSLSISLKEPIFGSTLAGISWASIPFTVKAIAFVQMKQWDTGA